MSELNINDLPKEMKTKVFRLLDAANLKNATLTCKLWKNVIEDSCQWSISLWLDFDENDYRFQLNSAVEKIQFVVETKRRFESFRIESGRLNEGSLIREIFRKHGFYVVKLDLCVSHIESLIAFAELLDLTPNLEYVKILMEILHDPSDVPDIILPELKKLKKLDMCETDYRLIQCFRKSKLTTMRVYDLEDLEHRSTLAHFILSEDALTSLTAESYGDSPSVLAEMGELDVPIRFRLTQLAMVHQDDRNATHDQNLLKILRSQANSLTEMEIGDGIPSSVYEYVFASMAQLNTLTVEPSLIPQDHDFYDRLQENGSVCTMKILDIERDEHSCDLQIFSSFVSKLPNIRNLFLSYNGCLYENILTVAARSLSKLEFLYMRFVDDHLIDDIDCVSFSNLKTLHIRILNVRINFINFTKIHSRLIELTIEKMSSGAFLTSDDMNQITTNVDLQNLKLGVGFVADDRFFEIIRKKCPNLKVLNLHKSCVSHGMNHNKENNLLRLVDVLECPTYSQNLILYYRPAEQLS